MHKFADDLQDKDQFIMAGGLYKIVGIAETSADDMIKLTFVQVNDRRRMTMIIERSLLFITY